MTTRRAFALSLGFFGQHSNDAGHRLGFGGMEVQMRHALDGDAKETERAVETLGIDLDFVSVGQPDDHEAAGMGPDDRSEFFSWTWGVVAHSSSGVLPRRNMRRDSNRAPPPLRCFDGTCEDAEYRGGEGLSPHPEDREAVSWPALMALS
jgi:hypothetical protein